MKSKVVLILCGMAFCLSLRAQERGVREKDLPAAMVDYLSLHYPDASRKEYFRKTENDTVFFETEFRDRKEEYNLTFLSTGELYEIEREIAFQAILPEVQSRIRQYLEAAFERFKIRTVQELNPQGNRQYELNIKARTKGDTDFYDVYFDREGKFVKQQEVRLNSIKSLY